MKAILVMELRGFEALAVALAREGEGVGLTSDRVRASGIALMKDLVVQASAIVPPEVQFHVGGDTWYFNFSDLPSAIQFAKSLSAMTVAHAAKYGTFFLKPSMAINTGKPQLDAQRFLDDASILAYRFADKGQSFRIRVVSAALDEARRASLPITEGIVEGLGAFGELNWLDGTETPSVYQVEIPRLLLDSDVQYSDGTAEAVDLMVRRQDGASTILSFGGPAPLTQPLYREYIKRTLISLYSDARKRFTVLSYIPLDEPWNSFAWLELCRRLQTKYPDQFAFAAFPIPEGQLRPFAYHVYDDRDVYVGLRSFSPQRGTATLSAGILFRTQQVALRFRDELHENFRKIGALDDQKYAAITGKLVGLTAQTRSAVVSDVEAIFADVGGDKRGKT